MQAEIRIPLLGTGDSADNVSLFVRMLFKPGRFPRMTGARNTPFRTWPQSVCLPLETIEPSLPLLSPPPTGVHSSPSLSSASNLSRMEKRGGEAAKLAKGLGGGPRSYYQEQAHFSYFSASAASKKPSLASWDRWPHLLNDVSGLCSCRLSTSASGTIQRWRRKSRAAQTRT